MSFRRVLSTTVLVLLLASAALINMPLATQARTRTAPPRDTTATAVAIARRHLAAHARALGVLPQDVEGADVTDVYRTRRTGVTHVYLRQRLNGIPVLEGAATVSVAADGSVLHVGAQLRRDVQGAARGRVVVSPAGAVAAAARHLRLGPVQEVEVLSAAGDEGRVWSLSAAGVATKPITVRLVYERTGGRTLRLAWEVRIDEPGGRHSWSVAVDATSARILRTYDYVIHEPVERTGADVEPHDVPRSSRPIVSSRPAGDGASYNVYALPLESPNDGDRSLVKNPADRMASPHGWHDTDGKRGPEHSTTRGNNVHAYADYASTGGLPGGATEADGGESLKFDFPLDFSQPPQLWRDAAVTNLFYWVNVTHDLAYRYGFDEPAGNFQVTNYTGKGAGNDAVRAEAQDGSGFDNANFAITPDGTPPTIQMYLWTTKLAGDATLVDGDLDAGVIVHEYGHGISTRLTGGPSSVDCLFNAEQGGEGWSDWFGLAFTARKQDLHRPRGMGTYVFGQADRHQRGIRPTAYSTDMKVNPATYDTIKTAAVPHGVGYVWATMMWDMYVELVDKYGFNPDPYGNWRTGGNNLAIQLVMDGLKMQPCNPGFVDARDAILASDEALTGGKNQCLIWRVFARRGLGVEADQGDSASVSDGRESTAVPRGC